MMARLCTHPNTGGVLLVSLGCESFDRRGLAQRVRESGRPVETLVIQERGGHAHHRRSRPGLAGEDANRTRRDGGAGHDDCGRTGRGRHLRRLRRHQRQSTANPAIGRCFDLLVENNASAIFEEGGELIGCERIMADRAVTPGAGRGNPFDHGEDRPLLYLHGQRQLCRRQCRRRAVNRRGKVDGGLCQRAAPRHSGTDQARRRAPGRPASTCSTSSPTAAAPRFGFPNINDTAEIAELIACGAHLTLILNRARLGRGIGDLSGGQSVRQPRDLPPHGRRHGRGRRSYSGRPGHP